MTRDQLILIDTDAIYASAVDADANHFRAVALQKKYSILHFYISDFVLGEAATLLSRRVGKLAADHFLSESSIQGLTLVYATEKIITQATTLFLGQNTKKTSFVDCVNMATAKNLSLATIFSFDSVYEKNGFTLLV